MRIGVIGAGALGLLLGGLIWENGGEVMIYTRRAEAARIINAAGVVIHSREGKRLSRPPATDDPSRLREAQLVIIAVKSYDTAKIAATIADNTSPSCIALTLQNGLGNVEELVEALGAGRVLGGVTSQASTLLGVNEVFHAYAGETVVGEPRGGGGGRAGEVAGLLTSLGVPTRVSLSLEREIWLKVVVNSVINPLTAILGVRNGELASLPGISPLIDRLVEECVSVARASGVEICVDEARRLTYSVMEKTGMNKSSMLQDIERGRRTEIDRLNGRVARLAAERGLEAPLNEALSILVKALESISAGR